MTRRLDMSAKRWRDDAWRAVGKAEDRNELPPRASDAKHETDGGRVSGHSGAIRDVGQRPVR
jgi:hypothetical protein